MMTQMKTCSSCKQEKRLADFSKNRSRKDGLCSECKVCVAKYHQTSAYKASGSRSRARSYSTVKGYLRNTFNNMKQRCCNLKHSSYKWYGGRGIKILFKSLDDFRSHVRDDLGIDPRGLTIDRIDNDGNYERGNIRFVTHKENCQNRNKRG